MNKFVQKVRASGFTFFKKDIFSAALDRLGWVLSDMIGQGCYPRSGGVFIFT